MVATTFELQKLTLKDKIIDTYYFHKELCYWGGGGRGREIDKVD